MNFLTFKIKNLGQKLFAQEDGFRKLSPKFCGSLKYCPSTSAII